MPDTVAARSAFKRILWMSVLVPVVVMASLAAVLMWQVATLLSQSRWVEHTDEVIAKLYRAEATMIDGQASARGYMLTGDDNQLVPFQAALDDLPRQMNYLRWLTRDRPEAGVLCDEIEQQRGIWSTYVSGRIDVRRTTGQIPPIVTPSTGSVAMAAARAAMSKWLNQELELRSVRGDAVQRSAKITLIATGAATLFIGIALSLMARGQLNWLAKTYEAALLRARELSASLEQRVEERTAELSIANGQLGEANKELEAFSYSISHDLRAPMRHITGFADLLRRSLGAKIEPDDADNLNIIYNTAVLAGRMVDDLLAFSRVGRTQLRIAEVDMNALVAQCVTELAPELRGRSVVWNIESLRPARGDSALLRMVFQNLISNAVKYTQKRDEARIDITSRAESDGTTFIVRDNGVGFDMAYVHKLFGVFQRLHRSEDFEGTGIGLANVRRIIVRHGGQVWAEGMPDGGAAFYVHLAD